MTSYATSDDVTARLGRQLTEDEQTQVPTLLSDTEILIRSRILDLDDKAQDEAYLAILKMVEANAVKRLIRNPDGYTSESDGEYTYQINYKLASGGLEITSQEWALLGVGSGIFTIGVRGRTPYEQLYADAPNVHPFMWGG